MDNRFCASNPAFERLTGLRRPTSPAKHARGPSGSEREWIERYGAVALTWSPSASKTNNGGLRRHFEVTAFIP